jgi:lysophospholipase L1-like esterase
MKSKTTFPNYLLSIVSFLLFWGILELMFLFVYNHLPNGFNNGKRIVEINARKKEFLKASIIPHPYMLYTNNPNYNDGIKQHNSLGYRGEEFNPVKDPNTIRILALGGSTTYGYLNKDPRLTWPALLQDKLRKHTGRNIEVINGGVKYGTSAELLAAYVFRHRYIKPDIIIFHEGGNDAMPVFFPDYNAEYTHFRGHGSGGALRNGEKFLLHSNILKVFYSLWLNSNETVYKAQPYSLAELDRKEAAKRVADDRNFEGFKRNVDLLMDLSRMDSARMLLFGFVHAREENLSKNREDHIGLEKTLAKCIAKNKAIMRNLATKHGAVYVEADQDLFKDEWFLDNCHLTPEGEAVKANVVFEKILPLIEQEAAGKP